MLYIFLTLLAFETRGWQTTSGQKINSSLGSEENNSFYENVDRFAETENSGQVSNNLIFNTPSKLRLHVESEDSGSLQEDLEQTGNGASSMNPNNIGSPDNAVMYDEPKLDTDWWLGREDKDVQERFLLSRPKDSPHAVLVTANASIQSLKAVVPIVCSGTLVTLRWVLTAASCLQGETTMTVSDILIYAGGRSLNELNRKHPSTFSQTRRSSKYFCHPEYAVFDDNKAANDVALVKAEKKFRLCDSVKMMLLVSEPWTSRGFVSCSVTGFGKVKLFTADSRDFMRKTYIVNVKKPCLCFEKEERAWSWLCAEPSDHSGVCMGDQGAGLICDGRLVAVTSALVPMSNMRYCSASLARQSFNYECGTVNMISTFHETYPYLEWIHGYIKRSAKERQTSGVAGVHIVTKINLSVLAYLIYYLYH